MRCVPLTSAAAQNFLCIQLAEAQGIVFGNPFMDWFSAASVPCILSILATPIIMYIMDPPVRINTAGFLHVFIKG